MKAKKFLWCLIALPLMPSYSAKSREQKPILAQCRTDADPAFVNAMQTKEFSAYRDYMKRFPLSEVVRRQSEMYECTNVDPTNSEFYKTIALILDTEEASRYMDFLMRHDLMDQFRAEDANGSR